MEYFDGSSATELQNCLDGSVASSNKKIYKSSIVPLCVTAVIHSIDLTVDINREEIPVFKTEL